MKRTFQDNVKIIYMKEKVKDGHWNHLYIEKHVLSHTIGLSKNFINTF